MEVEAAACNATLPRALVQCTALFRGMHSPIHCSAIAILGPDPPGLVTPVARLDAVAAALQRPCERKQQLIPLVHKQLETRRPWWTA